MFAQQISQIPGVAQVNIFGAQKYAVRIQADPEAAAARGLSLDDIRCAVAAANSNEPRRAPARDPRSAVALQASGQLSKAEDYSDLVVASRNGTTIKLGDVANIIDAVENDRSVTWFDGERSLVLAIFSSPTPTRWRWSMR